MSHSCWGSGIWWFSWVFLLWGLSWDCSQAINGDCVIFRLEWIWRIPFPDATLKRLLAGACFLAGNWQKTSGPHHVGLSLCMASWVSLLHGSWLPPKWAIWAREGASKKLQCLYDLVSKATCHHFHFFLFIRSKSLSPFTLQVHVRCAHINGPQRLGGHFQTSSCFSPSSYWTEKTTRSYNRVGLQDGQSPGSRLTPVPSTASLLSTWNYDGSEKYTSIRLNHWVEGGLPALTSSINYKEWNTDFSIIFYQKTFHHVQMLNKYHIYESNIQGKTF